MTDCKEDFLKKYSAEIKQRTRNPLSLADKLYGKKFISDEMDKNIRIQDQNMKQMRKIYDYLNSKEHYDYTYDWLKENEPHLFEELDPEKRSRGETNQNVDETENNHPGSPALSEPEPDLKMLSTFAKLESWISKPEVSQKLISDLDKKLGPEGMKDLKRDLNGKKPKNNLCFFAKDIDDIRKNKELEMFLGARNDAKFPKLTFNMFFKNASPCEEPMDITVDDLKSRRYGSSTSELNSTQNDDQANGPNEPITKTEPHTAGSMDVQDNEKANMQDNAEPFPSKLLQKNGPASDSMSSTSSWNTQVKSQAEITAQNTDPDMPAVKSQTGEPSCSNNKPALGTKESGMEKKNNLKKKNDFKNRLHDWAVGQCTGSEEELKNVYDHITILNNAEHRDYPCFMAEDITVYTNPETRESQIISNTENSISITTKTMAEYLMYVCDIKTAVLLGPSNQSEQNFNEPFIHINKCRRFVFEAFAPALAVFKKIQKERLCSHLRMTPETVTLPQAHIQQP